MGSVPVKRQKRARPAGGPLTFRSPTAVIVWWVWLLFAAANWVDLAVQGRDRESLVAAAILLLATGVAYVTAQRPRIIADDTGVTIRNPLRDHRVGWACVTKIGLGDLLRVHCDSGHPQPEGIATEGKPAKVISAWAVHYSRRRQFAAEARARRSAARESSGRSTLGLSSAGRGRGPGFGYGSTPASTTEAEAEKAVRQLSEYATAAKAETVWAAGTVKIAGADQAAEKPETGPPSPAQDSRLTGLLEPLVSTWSRPAIAALIIPALILLIVALI
jgi:hypothetical protein